MAWRRSSRTAADRRSHACTHSWPTSSKLLVGVALAGEVVDHCARGACFVVTCDRINDRQMLALCDASAGHPQLGCAELTHLQQQTLDIFNELPADAVVGD